jgi:hypothetical protein
MFGLGRQARPQSDPELATLKLQLKDLQYENKRLRDARSAITRQLGPLPISAAIVAGLVSGFTVSGKAHLKHTPAIWALVAFGLMVVFSVAYSALQPHRKLRERAEDEPDHPKPSDARDPVEWYSRMIRIERTVRGESIAPSKRWRRWLARVAPFPLPGQGRTLQTGCNLEWKGLFITKSLFVAVIALLIYART